jgi:isocitrate/isopropylmalate dehydrogenase
MAHRSYKVSGKVVPNDFAFNRNGEKKDNTTCRQQYALCVALLLALLEEAICAERQEQGDTVKIRENKRKVYTERGRTGRYCQIYRKRMVFLNTSTYRKKNTGT